MKKTDYFDIYIGGTLIVTAEEQLKEAEKQYEKSPKITPRQSHKVVSYPNKFQI